MMNLVIIMVIYVMLIDVDSQLLEGPVVLLVPVLVGFVLEWAFLETL